LTVAYDRLAESVALIEGRRIEPVRRLSRRRRFAAMAVDVSGDLAVTMFARRSVGCISKETHLLARRDGEWEVLGGGGSSGHDDDDLLADRPSELNVRVLGDDAAKGANQRVMGVRGGVGGWSRDGLRISCVELQVTAPVTSVQVADRTLVVPWHGHVVVVWSGERPPRVVAFDEGGTSLAEAPLPTIKSFWQ
jgi:hypothetical protein